MPRRGKANSSYFRGRWAGQNPLPERETCEMLCHPSEPSLSISRLAQIPSSWSEDGAWNRPLPCISTSPILTDLYGLDTGLLSSLPSPHQVPVAGRRTILCCQPPPRSQHRILTSLWVLWLGRPAVYPSSHERPETCSLAHSGCSTPAAARWRLHYVLWGFFHSVLWWSGLRWWWASGGSWEMSDVRAPPCGGKYVSELREPELHIVLVTSFDSQL